MNDFIKNPQTRNARAFLPLNISAVGSVSTDSLEIEAMQQKGFSQTSQGAKLTANNLFLAANSCKQIVYLFTFEGFQKVFQLDYEIHT